MGRLSQYAIALTLGAWGPAGVAACLGDEPPANVAPAPASRPPAPVPPVEYLKAGAKLFNGGQHALAGKYLKAAHDYRDQLSRDEQVALDEYLHALNAAGKADASVARTATVAPLAPSAAAPSSAKEHAMRLLAQARQTLALGRPSEAKSIAAQVQVMNVTFAAGEDTPQAVMADAEKAETAAITRGGTTDVKQKGRFLLKIAREAIGQGNLELAEQRVGEVERLNVKWGLFDDTPAKVRQVIAKARAAELGAKTMTPPAERTRTNAKTKLRDARAMLDAGRTDEAESLAMEVGTWGLAFGTFDDTPEKVMAAARSIRGRDEIRSAGSKAGTTAGVYEELVKEARALMAAGKLDEAKVKAEQASRMGAYPPATADRAETVLYDLTMMRQNEGVGPGAAESPAMALEREANALLAQGKQTEAAAKFEQADRLLIAVAQGSGKVDGAIQPADNPGAVAPPVMLAGAQPPVIASEPAPADLAAVPPATEPLPVPDQGSIPAPVPPPAAPALATDAPLAAPAVEVSPGRQSLEQAKGLLSSGNFAAARQKLEAAKAADAALAGEADDLASQIALAEQGGALELYESALDMIRKNQTDRASAMLKEVLASEAILDEGLKAKVQQLLERISVPAGAQAVVGVDDNDAETIRVQRLTAEVGDAVAEARRMIEVDPDKAIGSLQSMIDKVKLEDVQPNVARTMVRRLEVAIELAKKDKVDFDIRMQDRNERVRIEQKRLRILEADKAKLERFSALMKKATDSMNNEQFVEAETFAKQALEIDPNDVTATALAWKARVERRYKADVEIRDAKDDGIAAAFQDIDRSMIISPELLERGVIMPEKFADLTRVRRAAQERMAYRKTPQAIAIEKKLNDPITINADKQPLGETIDFLKNYSALNIVLDPKALADEGLTRESPVSLSANNIRLKSALKYLLTPLGLTYRVDDEVLLITTPQSSNIAMRSETYYVGDLVIGPHSKPAGTVEGMGQNLLASNVGAPNMNPISANTPFGPVPSGMFDEKGMPTAPLGGTGAGAAFDRPSSSNTDMSPLIQLIVNSIAPNTWRVVDSSGKEDPAHGGAFGFGIGDQGGLGLGGEAGAQIGTITPFYLNISLIIRHTDEVHEQLEDLLKQLRRLQDLQVSIEVRFITVSDDFFEQIGVDFDFQIQDDTVGPKSSFAIPNPNAVPFDPTTLGGGGGGGGGGGALPGPFLFAPNIDHAIGNRPPLVVGRAGPGDPGDPITNITPNLNIPFVQGTVNAATPTLQGFIPNAGATLGIDFLSDLEVYLFFQAAQSDIRSNVIQAPKVTTFNGAGANISNTRTQYYVQSVTPVVAFGAIAFQPQIAALPIGITLNVQPVVTADRRYVRLSLSPVFISNESFQTFEVSGAVGGGGIGGGATSVDTQIQLPTFNIFNVNTTVTVPDGGTVLLGGVKSSNEERREFGVPILSKTPFINRLFRNIGIGRTSQSVMLMVTPRIIILEEEEERIGIPPTIAL